MFLIKKKIVFFLLIYYYEKKKSINNLFNLFFSFICVLRLQNNIINKRNSISWSCNLIIKKERKKGIKRYEFMVTNKFYKYRKMN